jgi:hypothetical protein
VFGFHAERLENVVPESIQIATKVLEAAALDAVEPPGAVALRAHEPSALEDAQMLGHRGACDAKPARDAPDRERAAPEPLEDQAAGRIGEGLDRLLVSHD